MIDSVEPSTIIIQMGINFKQDYQTSVSSYGKWQKRSIQINEGC